MRRTVFPSYRTSPVANAPKRRAPAPLRAHVGTAPAYTQLLVAAEQAAAAGEPILTAKGLQFVEEQLALALRNRSDADEPRPSDAVPHWDGVRHLWLGERLVREFDRLPTCQAPLLAAFECAGWPRQIRNPFADALRRSAIDARRRLRQTVQNLNRHLPEATLHFHDDGVYAWWEPWRETEI